MRMASVTGRVPRQCLTFLGKLVLQQSEAYLGRLADLIDAERWITRIEMLEFLRRFIGAFEQNSDRSITSVARIDIRERLATGKSLVLDGAMGSELQRRGVWVSHGATADTLGTWSATAMRDAPEVV